MKVTLYMATSVNGFIAKTDGDSGWLTEEEAESFTAAVRAAGCFIVGTNTYNVLTDSPEFADLKDVQLIVVSRNEFSVTNPAHLVAHSPKEALKLAEGFNEVIVAGGGLLNASFLAEDLVDEMYLDIEPIILGEGIPLFHGQSFERNLTLLDQKMLSNNEIQLHYQVRKVNESSEDR